MILLGRRGRNRKEMKKENILLAFIIVILIGMLYHDVVGPRIDVDSNRPDPTTENIVYSEEFTERLREEVITELYGSREYYATEHTGSRADYVDKEASKSGELVIDEVRMQQVYDSKLKEFDDMVRGLDIIVVTTANTDEEARELLTQFGMPFAK